VLQVFGRELTLPRTCGGLLDTTFDDMCVKVSKFQNSFIWTERWTKLSELLIFLVLSSTAVKRNTLYTVCHPYKKMGKWKLLIWYNLNSSIMYPLYRGTLFVCLGRFNMSFSTIECKHMTRNNVIFNSQTNVRKSSQWV